MTAFAKKSKAGKKAAMDAAKVTGLAYQPP